MKKVITFSFIGLSVIINSSFIKSADVAPPETWMVTTFAGYSDNGISKDGKGTDAAFSSAVKRSAVDAAGNLYVFDQANLRKIDTDGNVSTLFGNSVVNPDGTNLNVPSLKGASGICIDKLGTIYLSSGGNNMIYKVKPDMTVENYAGDDGYKGSDDGAAIGAGFYNPQGLCIDKAGNIYVADTYNYKVRKISADGKTVTTLAGKGVYEDFKPGTGKAAVFSEFWCVAVDSKGNVYVPINASRGTAIAKITPAGVVTSFAGDVNELSGEGNDGTGKAARFFRINAIAVDNEDNIIIGENYRVRKATPSGVVTTLAGINEAQWRDAVGPKARFGMINGLSVDNKGNIFVSDSYCVRKMVKQ